MSRSLMVVLLLAACVACVMGLWIAAVSGRARRPPTMGLLCALGGIVFAIYWALRLAGA